MRKRGTNQSLLPTPQTSTTSSTWDKDDYEVSSEVEEGEENVNLRGKRILRVFSEDNLLLLPPPLSNKRPRLLRSSVKTSYNWNSLKFKSSWPFRSSNPKEKIDFFFEESFVSVSCGRVDLLKENGRLRRALERDFPYERAIEGLSASGKRLLFDEKLWKFLIKVATIYAGEDVEGDRQKRTEIAFASWTTLLRVYGKIRVRGGEAQLERLAVAAVVLQSKLLEESDVDLVKLTRKLGKLTTTLMQKNKIEANERKIAALLDWKLLTPSPQVILFLLLDALSGSIPIPTSLKLLVSKVLDKLIEGFFVQEYLLGGGCGRMGRMVRLVIEAVLEDFFSAFQGGGGFKIGEILSATPAIECESRVSELKKKIELAIEEIVNVV